MERSFVAARNAEIETSMRVAFVAARNAEIELASAKTSEIRLREFASARNAEIRYSVAAVSGTRKAYYAANSRSGSLIETGSISPRPAK